ncbi:twin-arginine translocation pathway signal [Laetiporus sulphureus 93-53]|uniref:Twin-arginine translocation pathway signal n=1 Tax=Laetiporus sulphureus 93-53 TaxID=1314785 RepID=A0A165IJP8_9APHY|nr:twin-arginine translocation pathway signal [Laetiporus sulphureus 93-53]KZT13172.1 twin-arginine translocation pathway signal [Laetiporus sulphureus 93-53]
MEVASVEIKASAEVQASTAVAISNDDILNALKAVVQFGLSQIPYVGKLISALVGVLWPSSGPSVWDQVREEVEKLIDQKITDAIFSLLKAQLNGLGDALKLYINAVKSGGSALIRTQFVATNTVFVAARSSFQNPDYQWVLSPLFAIFTQLHMTLLRDCVLNGEDWGWTSAEYQTIVDQASQATKDYIAYLDKVVADKEADLKKGAPSSPGKHKTDIWQYWQAFNQQKIVLIDDYRLLLVYLDPVTHPKPTSNIPFKDVYSRAYGTADDWDATASGWASSVTTPWGKPLANISNIKIELFNYTPRVVDVNYPKGEGPALWGSETDRKDTTGIIANYQGGVEKYTVEIPRPSSDKTYNIQKASVKQGSIPLNVTLTLDDGTEKNLWNRTDLGGQTYVVEVPGRMLTTFNMWTRSWYYNNDLGCIIFGFSRDPKAVPPQAYDAFYVGAIGEPEIPATYSVSSQVVERRLAFWSEVDALKP